MHTSDDGKDMDENGKSYVNTLLKNGLELFAFLGNNKKEVFVLIRAPADKLKIFCDQLDFNILLDPKVLKEMAERGNEIAHIAPFSIAHNPVETAITPYEFIYAPYRVDLPHELYGHNIKGQTSLFKELVRLKITMSLIEAKPPDGGENLKIRRYIMKDKILALYPIHTPEYRIILKEKLMKFSLKPWEIPLEEIKVIIFFLTPSSI